MKLFSVYLIKEIMGILKFCIVAYSLLFDVIILTTEM